MPTSVSKCRRTFRKLLISVFTSFFLNANIVCAEARTFQYEVTWKFVTVGTIELNLVKLQEKNWISLSARTQGPFKFFRSYDVNVVSTQYGSGERTYELKSLDRGVGEERFIRYGEGEAPIVVRFRELDTAKPLATSVEYDGSSVDPFYILAEFLDRMEVGEGCDGIYQVYDAKRRYKVTAITASRISSVLNENLSSVMACRVLLDASSIESAAKRESGSTFGGLRSMLNIWPFTRQNQVLELQLELDDQGSPYPSGFRLKTPFGSIVAALLAQEEE